MPLMQELDFRLDSALGTLAIFQGAVGIPGNEVNHYVARSGAWERVALLRLARGEPDQALLALRESLVAAELSISHVDGLAQRLFYNNFHAFSLALMLGDADKVDEYARVISSLRGKPVHDDYDNIVERSYLRPVYEALACLWLGQEPDWDAVRHVLGRLLALKRRQSLWVNPGLLEALEAVGAGAVEPAVAALGQMLDDHHRQMTTFNTYLDSASEAVISPLALLLVAVASRRGMDLKPLLAPHSQRLVLLRPMDRLHRKELAAGAKAPIELDYLPELFLRAWRPALV